MSIRKRRKPVNCAQDIRDWTGYRILQVQSNKEDLNARIILQNNQGEMVKIYLNNLCLDGTMIKYKPWRPTAHGDTIKKRASVTQLESIKKNAGGV